MDTPATQLRKYLEKDCDYDATDNSCCLPFWQVNKQMLNLLFEPALRALSVPASSAPVECMFSHGGIVMSPHRARMTDKTLTSIVFLKCNAHGGITNSALQLKRVALSCVPVRALLRTHGLESTLMQRCAHGSAPVGALPWAQHALCAPD